jgi:hypothetical protein
MSRYSIIDEFEQGMLCLDEAQELLDDGAPREQVMDRLNDAVEALEFFARGSFREKQN